MPSRIRASVARAAWIAFVASWFLPAMHAPIAAGWKAFLVTLLMTFKPDIPILLRGLCIAGVLSNVAVALTPWMFRKPAMPPWFVISLIAAFVVNLAWIPLVYEAELNVGYWLWIGSIGALAVVAALNRRGSAGSAY